MLDWFPQLRPPRPVEAGRARPLQQREAAPHLIFGRLFRSRRRAATRRRLRPPGALVAALAMWPRALTLFVARGTARLRLLWALVPRRQAHTNTRNKRALGPGACNPLVSQTKNQPFPQTPHQAQTVAVPASKRLQAVACAFAQYARARHPRRNKRYATLPQWQCLRRRLNQSMTALPVTLTPMWAGPLKPFCCRADNCPC